MARWGTARCRVAFQRNRLGQAPPDQRMMSRSSTLGPQRRTERRPNLRSIFFSLRSSSGGPRCDFTSAAAFAKSRRSEEHTSELQSLMRISYAVFCLKKKKTYKTTNIYKKINTIHQS